MANTTTAAHFSAAGHLQQDTVQQPEGTGTTDDALVVGSVVYRKSTGNLGKNTGATEAIAAGIQGVADGTYAGTSTASFFEDGQLVTGLSGLTAGVEYWARDDGTLDTYANVGSGKWTRPMGVAESATTLRVALGDVVQKP